MEDSGYDILCGSVGSGSVLVRVQAAGMLSSEPVPSHTDLDGGEIHRVPQQSSGGNQHDDISWLIGSGFQYRVGYITWTGIISTLSGVCGDQSFCSSDVLDLLLVLRSSWSDN